MNFFWPDKVGKCYKDAYHDSDFKWSVSTDVGIHDDREMKILVAYYVFCCWVTGALFFLTFDSSKLSSFSFILFSLPQRPRKPMM